MERLSFLQGSLVVAHLGHGLLDGRLGGVFEGQGTGGQQFVVRQLVEGHGAMGMRKGMSDGRGAGRDGPAGARGATLSAPPGPSPPNAYRVSFACEKFKSRGWSCPEWVSSLFHIPPGQVCPPSERSLRSAPKAVGTPVETTRGSKGNASSGRYRSCRAERSGVETPPWVCWSRSGVLGPFGDAGAAPPETPILWGPPRDAGISWTRAGGSFARVLRSSPRARQSVPRASQSSTRAGHRFLLACDRFLAAGD
ncbi:hypothetical protein GGP51_000677 [Salinibacter ruber]|nr:hypothetical protein [Salinibacter ruber]MCS3821569.1 hypothetical protein [Salinibacter ruber]MCS4182609.1 hypothetical protein [Salinibacter ruber]MCS4189213.1 hypothetical protein [Salinibacter ruber]